jgi:hypothetical protein
MNVQFTEVSGQVLNPQVVVVIVASDTVECSKAEFYLLHRTASDLQIRHLAL